MFIRSARALLSSHIKGLSPLDPSLPQISSSQEILTRIQTQQRRADDLSSRLAQLYPSPLDAPLSLALSSLRTGERGGEGHAPFSQIASPPPSGERYLPGDDGDSIPPPLEHPSAGAEPLGRNPSEDLAAYDNVDERQQLQPSSLPPAPRGDCGMDHAVTLRPSNGYFMEATSSSVPPIVVTGRLSLAETIGRVHPNGGEGPGRPPREEFRTGSPPEALMTDLADLQVDLRADPGSVPAASESVGRDSPSGSIDPYYRSAQQIPEDSSLPIQLVATRLALLQQQQANTMTHLLLLRMDQLR